MYSILNTVAVMLQPTPQIPHRIKKTNSELACILFESETKDINFKRTKTNSKGHNDGMEILGIKCCMFYKKYKSRNKLLPVTLCIYPVTYLTSYELEITENTVWSSPTTITKRTPHMYNPWDHSCWLSLMLPNSSILPSHNNSLLSNK